MRTIDSFAKQIKFDVRYPVFGKFTRKLNDGTLKVDNTNTYKSNRELRDHLDFMTQNNYMKDFELQVTDSDGHLVEHYVYSNLPKLRET
jgi:hypothetical protein